MVTLATPQLMAEMPELSDAAYYNQVLRLPIEKSEDHIDDELVARAQALGITTTLSSPADKRYTSSAESASSTAPTYHARTFSTGSSDSTGTALTERSSLSKPDTILAPERNETARRTLNFAHYDKYLAQLGNNLDQPKFRKQAVVDTSSKSLFSVSTKRSLASVKSNIKNRMRWRRRSTQPFTPQLSCVCCRDDFQHTSKAPALHTLPCGHTYCAHCLRVMVSQAAHEEDKFPPRCCTQPIPGAIVKAILTRDNQQAFLKAVVLFSTPWEARVFCPKPDCGEFIPPRHKVDPKRPFDVTCRQCRTRVCVMCKRDAHPVGKTCPEDYELEKVLEMAEQSKWMRCYKCRNLVELAHGCTHMTCRCKAQFCYICGGVWDATLGCPNVCSGEEELERRRAEEEERSAELEAEKMAREAASAQQVVEREEAAERTRGDAAWQRLQESQACEQRRFIEFASRTTASIRKRHEERRCALHEKRGAEEEKMRDRHGKTAAHLEDRQVAAEMELRASLEQSERSVRIRLKHMEAYCDGLGRNPSAQMPHRTVTERDLRELGQQYNLRDNLERLHQSKINVMRDRQAKRMEELQERQQAELEKLGAKLQEEVEDVAAQCAHEMDAVTALFDARRARLQKRWDLAAEVLCKELTERDGQRYAQLPTPSWPAEADEEGLGTPTG
ncbi:putative E3 ubiquitin-protein ligase-like protein [Emericellopsis cladophorae]|uniref:RBR-type E3 ubiquitin transferase n=1 Tax=Emericellopsis cladophorae TaxID=2686198 RepID=A0A9Q0BCY8_9HYPO|nr:putative E3 ubiquitin-protein ligase-like protein [Emericellopsis cladophorae]KAI6780020.1 putative E3 ubiquitin-protein ligase-like protein [Emericellopsis cladophorae]